MEIAFALNGKLQGGNESERLPIDICRQITILSTVRNALLKCALCKCVLLEEDRTKLFLAHTSTSWVYDEKSSWLVTSRGNCRPDDTVQKTSSVDTLHLVETEGLICPDSTPSVLYVAGQAFSNCSHAIIMREWYKCIIQEDSEEDMFVCARCLLCHLRKQRCAFNYWQIYCAQIR